MKESQDEIKFIGVYNLELDRKDLYLTLISENNKGLLEAFKSSGYVLKPYT